ncbi:MAG: CARDB domain-containing protein [Thermoplasmatota archaeon]
MRKPRGALLTAFAVVLSSLGIVVAPSVAADGEGQPDLVPAGVYTGHMLPLEEGDSVDWLTDVRNEGAADAGQFRTLFYMDGTLLNDYTFPGMLSGSAGGTGAHWQATAGEHVARFVVDSDNGVDESNEANNEFILQFTVDASSGGRADLVPQVGIQQAEPVHDGDQVSFLLTVQNRGGVDAGGFRTLFYLDDVLLSDNSFPGVSRNGEAATGLWWNATGGDHTARFVADTFDDVGESNETNNAYTLSFTVGPDVDLSAPVLTGVALDETSAEPGDVVTATVSVEDPSGIKLINVHYGRIGGGEIGLDFSLFMDPVEPSGTFTIQGTIPANAQPGEYGLRSYAIEDAYSNRAEDNWFGNPNLASGYPTITVDSSSEADLSAPVLTGLVLNETSAEPGDVVTADVSVEDPSGIRLIYVRYGRIGGGEIALDFSLFMDPAQPSGTFTIQGTIPANAQPGEYGLQRYRIYDAYSNWAEDSWYEHPNLASSYPTITISIDSDGDGVPDANDDCPAANNPDQLDSDGDGQGNACDFSPYPPGSSCDDGNTSTANDTIQSDGATCLGQPDQDADGVADDDDNCVAEPNGEQSDLDSDGQGDSCDVDRDGDGFDNDLEGMLGTDPNEPMPGSFGSSFCGPNSSSTFAPKDLDGDGVPALYTNSGKSSDYTIHENGSVSTSPHSGLCWIAGDPDDDDGAHMPVAVPETTVCGPNASSTFAPKDLDGDGVPALYTNVGKSSDYTVNEDGSVSTSPHSGLCWIAGDADDDGQQRAPASEPVGDGFVSEFYFPGTDAPVADTPVITLDRPVEIILQAREIVGSTVRGYSGPATLFLQVDCGELAPVLLAAAPCADAGAVVHEVAIQLPTSGDLIVTIPAAELADAFGVDGAFPLSAVHIFLADDERTGPVRYTSYSAGVTELVDVDATVADRLEADNGGPLFFTPVVLAQVVVPTSPVLGDGFVARFQIGLLDEGVNAWDGGDLPVNVAAFGWDGSRGGQGLYTGPLVLFVQRDCGALQPALAETVACQDSLETIGGPIQPSTQTENVYDFIVPASIIEDAFDGQPATALHFFVQAGEQYSHFNVAKEPLVTAGWATPWPGQYYLFAAADALEEATFTPVVLVQAPADLVGDGFVAAFGLGQGYNGGAAPAFTMGGPTAFGTAEPMTVYGTAYAFVDGSYQPYVGNLVLHVQVDCGALALAVGAAVPCMHDQVFVQQVGIDTGADGSFVHVFQQGDFNGAFSLGTPLSAVHIFAADDNRTGLPRYTSYSTPIKALLAADVGLADSMEADSGGPVPFTPVLFVSGSSSTPSAAVENPLLAQAPAAFGQDSIEGMFDQIGKWF